MAQGTAKDMAQFKAFAQAKSVPLVITTTAPISPSIDTQNVMRLQFFAGQKCRKNHQEERPEIGDETDLNRRRISDRR